MPGEELRFTLMGVNDSPKPQTGEVKLRLLNAKGVAVYTGKISVTIPASGRLELPHAFTLPKVAGGYLLETAFTGQGAKEPSRSRRYLKVGELAQYGFYEMPVPGSFLGPSARK